MITSANLPRWHRVGKALARTLAFVCLAGMAAALPPDAAAQDLLGRCWTPSELAGRAGEKAPSRGAPGHAARVPERRLQSFAAIEPALQGAIRRVALPPGRKLVALTFDLCEQPGEIAGYDGAIVDHLRANGIRATFFAGGKWLMTHAERAAQLAADPRFEIASHGWAHRNVRGLEGRALETEIQGPQAAYEATRASLLGRQCVAAAAGAGAHIQPRIGLYRFPYGACNPAALAAVAANGLLAVQWDVSAGDPDPGQSAAAITSAVLGKVRPGSIVLLHANGRGYNTAAALPALVKGLQARGYQLVTVSELLAAGRPEIVSTCYDARPGDTDRYDRLFSFRTEVRHGR